MRERLRDKSYLTDALNLLGVDAEMAERGRIQKPWGKRSLGIIDMPEGPVRWINVKQDGSRYSQVVDRSRHTRQTGLEQPSRSER